MKLSAKEPQGKVARTIRRGLFPLLFAALAAGCSGDMNDIKRFERKDPPEQEIVHARIHRTEDAVLQMELDAPVIRRYSQPSPRTVYPQGVQLRFFDTQQQPKTYISADNAISFDDRNIMKANRNVVVIDYTNGDTIYLEDLVWRQDDDVIFSNHPVKAVNGPRVTLGDGFSSDGRMTNLRITHQRGTIEINE